SMTSFPVSATSRILTTPPDQCEIGPLAPPLGRSSSAAQGPHTAVRRAPPEHPIPPFVERRPSTPYRRSSSAARGTRAVYRDVAGWSPTSRNPLHSCLAAVPPDDPKSCR